MFAGASGRARSSAPTTFPPLWVIAPSTINAGPTLFITTEFGIGLTIAGAILAVYFWRRRGELPSPTPKPAAGLPAIHGA